MAEGVELANHWTHSAPCSPSRATMMTGRYLPGHQVYDNTVFKWHHSLDPAIPTVGSQLGGDGYRSSYIGKWHLTGGPTPPMDLYGYTDWDGNDQHFMGWAGTGVHFDPVIADSAARWLDANGGQADPWFLTVALVNPHDVMWFPMDQPGYQADHPDELAAPRRCSTASKWKDDAVVPPFTDDYADVVDHLPANFDDDLLTKPALPSPVALGPAALAGRATSRPTTSEQWRRQLDYYVRAPPAGRREPRHGARRARAQRRVGRHRRRSSPPTTATCAGRTACARRARSSTTRSCGCRCYVKPAGRREAASAGQRSESLSSHVDLARTICGFAGVEPDDGMQGVDLGPLVADPTATVRDHVLFAHATAHTATSGRPAGRSAGSSTAATSTPATTASAAACPTTTSPACPPRCSTAPTPAFEDQEHEWYDQQEDPHELVNLAMDNGRRSELRARFEDLLAIEASRARGDGPGSVERMTDDPTRAMEPVDPAEPVPPAMPVDPVGPHPHGADRDGAARGRGQRAADRRGAPAGQRGRTAVGQRLADRGPGPPRPPHRCVRVPLPHHGRRQRRPDDVDDHQPAGRHHDDLEQHHHDLVDDDHVHQHDDDEHRPCPPRRRRPPPPRRARRPRRPPPSRTRRTPALTEVSYEGSDRQRRQRRRTRIVAGILALALLVPILAGTFAAIGKG